MANSAMSFLADTDARLEVRAEAARTLGLMQVNAVPEVQLQARRAMLPGCSRRMSPRSSTTSTRRARRRAENPTKARYLAALLVGPVYQCFDGVEGESNSGILQTAKADADSMKYLQIASST